MVISAILRRKSYILKARINRNWEDVAEYDRKVSITEIKPYIDDLFDSGYDYVALYECDKKRCKHVWSKRKSTKPLGELEQSIEVVKKLKSIVNEISPNPNIDDILAHIIYMDNIYRTLAQKLKSYMGGNNDPLERFFELLMTVLMARTGIQPQLQANPGTSNINNNDMSQSQEQPPPKEFEVSIPEQARDVARRIISEAEAMTDKELAPCRSIDEEGCS